MSSKEISVEGLTVRLVDIEFKRVIDVRWDHVVANTGWMIIINAVSRTDGHTVNIYEGELGPHCDGYTTVPVDIRNKRVDVSLLQKVNEGKYVSYKQASINGPDGLSMFLTSMKLLWKNIQKRKPLPIHDLVNNGDNITALGMCLTRYGDIPNTYIQFGYESIIVPGLFSDSKFVKGKDKISRYRILRMYGISIPKAYFHGWYTPDSCLWRLICNTYDKMNKVVLK